MLRLPALLLALAGLLAACGGDDPATTSDDAASGPDAATLADGTHFGFVVAVDPDRRTVTFDEATWVDDDDEANGYRIEDTTPGTTDLDVAQAATILVLTATGDPSAETAVDLAGLSDWYRNAEGDPTAFDVLVEDGAVTSMSYRYRP